MTDLEKMTNEIYEAEVLEVFETTKADDTQAGFQLIGWRKNLAPEHRDNTTLSDGFIFSDMPTLEYYAALMGFQISRIKEVEGAKSLWIAYCEQSLKDEINGTNFCNKYWKNFLTPNEV